MPKRSSKNQPYDPNLTAFRVVQEATGDDDARETPPPKKNPHAVRLGRLGGKKGGKRRLETMTPEQRSRAARKAALARWRKRKTQGET